MTINAESFAQNLTRENGLALAKSYHVLANSSKLRSLLSYVAPGKDFSTYSKYQLHQLINESILSTFRGEAYIKQLLVKRFIEEDAVAAFEIKTGESRLDFLRINGASISYEIKSEIDSLRKLKHQVENYRNLFEYNYVVLDKIHLSKAREILPEKFGIMETVNDELIYRRQAKKNRRLNAEAQLSIFTKKELHRYFKADKEEVLNAFPKSRINEVFKTMLKGRYKARWQFLKDHLNQILPIDYQYFFQSNIPPSLIYR